MVPGSDRVYLEVGKRWVFACAVDWPGWCRRAKGDSAAIDTLVEYAPRYRAVLGPDFGLGEVRVVGRVDGNATTDFGAPAVIGPWDMEPLDEDELERQLGVLEAAWRTFDAVVAAAPLELRKGPRGGGRDRDQVAEHVYAAERAYSGKAFGVPVPPRISWADQRASITASMRDHLATGAWPRRYALRRLAWHVLDHAWEIEDRSSS